MAVLPAMRDFISSWRTSMTEGPETQVSETQIAVHWREEEYVYPSQKFIDQANAADPAIYDRFSEDRFPDCFKEYADLLSWDVPWHTTLDTSNPPFWKWFVGGRLNASYNCVDRHAKANPDKAAIVFVPEIESDAHVHITYSELQRQVNEFAAVLRDSLGLTTGDRVTLHMPMVPELPVTMLACARLGIIHSQVFGGFSGNACGTRIADSGSRVLITMDGYYRSGQLIDHKVKADEAVEEAAREGQEVDKVLVWRRHPGQYASRIPMAEGRDVFVDEVLAGHRGIPRLCGRDVQVLPGHPPRRHVLVHGRHRLDHRPLLHRLRAAGARHHDGGLRGGAQLPRRGPAVADRRKARGEYLPHLSHGHPDAAQGRPRGAEEVRLPLQAHDYGGRAHRAGGVAVVSLRGRQGRGGHRRHLVADRDRRLPRHRAARAQTNEAGQLRPRGARYLPGHLRRERRRCPRRQGREHLHTQPLARDLRDHLGAA